jgi:hypothetical protein
MQDMNDANETRFEDEIDRDLIAHRFRVYTEPAARRSLRYDTAANASYAWLYLDTFAEWSRHRGKDIC